MRMRLEALAFTLILTLSEARCDPLSPIKDLPERKLFQADENGYPRVADADKPAVALLALSDATSSDLRFAAVWGLAISGYSPDSARTLLKVAANRTLSETIRGYACMGLEGFNIHLENAEREAMRKSLRETVRGEAEKSPDSILRLLIRWNDAPWIAETLGDKLINSTIEVDVLQKLPAQTSVPRLLEIYASTPHDKTSESYSKRAAVASALVGHKDRRGIDILDSLLDAGKVPEISDGVPSHQYRHNVFRGIIRQLGSDFGYKHLNYDPSIDEAIARFRQWWLINRYEFSFKPSQPTDGK